MRPARAVGLLVVLGGVMFGFWGGEYSTFDWWGLRREVARERAMIERLDAEIDSLTMEAEALESDSATQERVARERFGMVRSGEMLFRVEPAEP